MITHRFYKSVVTSSLLLSHQGEEHVSLRAANGQFSVTVFSLLADSLVLDEDGAAHALFRSAVDNPHISDPKHAKPLRVGCCKKKKKKKKTKNNKKR